MGGVMIDPGMIAQNIITYFSGPGGGFFAAAAGLVTYLLAAIHVMQPRAGWITTCCVAGAWIFAWIVRGMIGWTA
jgi:hypothetical protein